MLYKLECFLDSETHRPQVSFTITYLASVNISMTLDSQRGHGDPGTRLLLPTA